MLLSTLGAVFVLLMGCDLQGDEPDALTPESDVVRLALGDSVAAPQTQKTADASARSRASVDGLVAHRYGLNLGGTSSWGAEQLLANVVANPGFEAVLDRSLVELVSMRPGQVGRSLGWNDRAAGFWRGATGEVLTGTLRGQTFVVSSDEATGRNGQARLELSPPLSELGKGDVLSLQTASAPALPARWWGQGSISTVPGAALGSTGRHAVRLQASADQVTVLSTYIDTLERAGRLLPVTGAWQLRFFVRSVARTDAQLRVRLVRNGGAVFVDQVISAGEGWQPHQIAFQGFEHPGGTGTLALSFSVVRGDIELDDVYLGEAQPGAGGFRRVVVETLQALRPGYLRDWQGQLGDTAANRLATDSARQPVRYRPGDNEVLHTYSVAQLFALCQAVGARPWVILPTTLGEAEARQFGAAIRVLADQHGIDRVMLEFGNENWNPLFSAAGLVSPTLHAVAAGQALAAARAGFVAKGEGGPMLVTVVNARMGDVQALAELDKLASADRIALGSYFAYRLDEGQTLAAGRAEGFASAQSPDIQQMQTALRGQHTRLSAYEVNLHTTEGNAGAPTRNALAAGAASGPMLARRLIESSLAGMAEQAVYTLAGFDAFTSQGDAVRLFGVTRDLASAHRLRPTGVALGMLNDVARGKMYSVGCLGLYCKHVSAIGFIDSSRRWALVNGELSARPVRLVGACNGQQPTVRVLDGHDPWLNNETAALVSAQSLPATCVGADLLLTAPGYSLITVQ